MMEVTKMLYNVKVQANALTPEEMSQYAKYWEQTGHTPTGETLTETFPDGSAQTLVVFKGSYTPYGMCRDCGDHYIIARYARYDKIDKKTLAPTLDWGDK